jgi:hypothetical protein
MSAWSMTKEQVPNFLRGLDRARWHGAPILPPRSPVVDILGAGLHTGVCSESADFQSWLAEFIPDVALREKLCIELDILQAIHPKAPLSMDLSAQDFPESALWKYLVGIKDSGFRGRIFDLESHSFPLFTTPAEMGFADAFVRLGRHQYGPAYGYGSTLFRAIEVKADLPEVSRYTEATHIAGRFNCPNLLKALANSPANYLKQDNSHFLGVLDGLTALHHAALGFSPKVMEFLLKDCGIDFTTALDKNGNTLLHALACSKGPAEKQLGMLQDLVKLLFDLEFDAEKRERFYQHKNTAGDTALNVAANAKNKELVQKLMFLPGADTEEKSDAHPKGVDFTGLGIHYGKLLSHEYALLFEKNLAFGERLDRQEEVVMNVVAALRATVAALEDAKEEIALLKQNQLLLMQMVGALAAGNPEAQRLIAGVGGRLAAPFLALGDAPTADEGVEEAKEPDSE